MASVDLSFATPVSRGVVASPSNMGAEEDEGAPELGLSTRNPPKISTAVCPLPFHQSIKGYTLNSQLWQHNRFRLEGRLPAPPSRVGRLTRLPHELCITGTRVPITTI